MSEKTILSTKLILSMTQLKLQVMKKYRNASE